MSALLTVPELALPHATECLACLVHHYPAPLRFVWHHILPQEAGGLTTTTNLVAVCDTGHYAIHALMYHLAKHSQLPKRAGTRGQRNLALAGYTQAKTLGTVDHIPNEGSVL